MEFDTRSPKQATEIRQAGLVAAAMSLAAERNPADITTADLARAVGISQGAVFKHFSSKEAIWLAVLDWTADSLLARLHEAVIGPTPLHALQAIFAAHVDFVMEHPGVPRVIFQELQHASDSPLKGSVRKIMQQHRMLVTDQLKRAQVQNLLRPGTDLQAAAVLFLGAVQGLVMQAMVSGQVQSMAAQAPGVFTIYLRGIAPSVTHSIESTP